MKSVYSPVIQQAYKISKNKNLGIHMQKLNRNLLINRILEMNKSLILKYLSLIFLSSLVGCLNGDSDTEEVANVAEEVANVALTSMTSPSEDSYQAGQLVDVEFT